MSRFNLPCGDALLPATMVREGRHLWLVELPGGVQAWVMPSELVPASDDAIVPHHTLAERAMLERGLPCDPSSYDIGGAP